MRHHSIAPLVLLVALGAAALPMRAQTVVEATVAQAARYVDHLTGQVDGVVVEEKYLQQAQGRVVTARELTSDMAIMADPQFGWIEFRDVFEVDGTPVRDRQDRVVELFASPRADAMEQAQRIVEEGARHNLNPVGVRFARTINLPMTALRYLQASNQHRSEFQRVSIDFQRGRRVLIVRFEEKEMPRLIGSVDSAPARGRFWIDQETGVVLQSELAINSRRGTTDIQARIEVLYADVPELGMWLPESMEEHYDFSDGMGRPLASISGRALYSNYRKFRVDIQENVIEEDTAEDYAVDGNTDE